MRIEQTSEKNGRRWRWTVSLNATQEELNSVEKVVYHLHPTFKTAIIEKTNRSENFALKRTGWGTFVIRLEVYFKNGTVEKMRHRLRFEHEKPKVFLAYSESQTNPEIIKAVRDRAIARGFDVSSSDNISLDEDWESALNTQIEEAQLLLMVGGDSPSRSVMQEVEIAKQLGKKVLAFDVGNLYGISGSQYFNSSDDLLNALDAFDFKAGGDVNFIE